MISFYPSIYDNFLCKGEACHKNCCQGWDIELDEDTATLYLGEEGTFGDILRSRIAEGEHGHHIQLREDGKCPFQEPNGLCTIILEKGEEYLSNICQNHPRFYEYLDDFEFCGIGLSCERTCEMLAEGNLSFVREEEGEFAPCTFQELLEEVGGVGDAVRFVPAFKRMELRQLLFLMRSVNILHPQWKYEIECMQEREEVLLEEAKVYWASEAGKTQQGFFNAVYEYILYRALVRLDAFDFADIERYARLSTEFILYHYVSERHKKTLLEIVAEWSEEIEYDTENMEYLIESFMSLGI